MEQEVLIYRVGTDKHGVRTPHTPVMALGGVILVLLPGGLCACVFASVFSFQPSSFFSLLFSSFQSERFCFSSVIQLCGCKLCYFRQVHYPSTNLYLLYVRIFSRVFEMPCEAQNDDTVTHSQLSE